MDPSIGRLLVALGVVAVGLVAYAMRRASRGRGWAPPVPRMSSADVDGGLDGPLTLVYFTSRFCHDCAQVPAVALAAAPEVRLVPISVNERPDLARKYLIQATPTVLLVDDAGRIRYAHVGLPVADELWLYVREAWDSTAAVRRMDAERRATALSSPRPPARKG